VSRKVETHPDFIRAKILLNKRFHTPHDLIVYWSMSGPCREPHPEIEDISE
jgi:hypothetical protein